MPVLESVSDLESKYAQVSLVRGRCALMLGKLDDALARAERYRKAAPNAIEGWVLLGDVRGAQNNWKEAEAAYSRVVENNPNDATSSLKLARAERMQAKFAAAAERLRAAGPPKNYEDDWTLEYGETLYEEGRFADSLAALDNALQLDPEWSEIHYGRARTLLAMTRLAEMF